MEKKRVTIRVAGKDYNMTSSDSEAYVRRVAAYVDRKIGELTLATRLPAADAAVLAAGAVVMLAVDLLHERGHHLRSELAARPLPLRWAVMIAGVVAVMLFGAYGDHYDPAGFIYAQF